MPTFLEQFADAEIKVRYKEPLLTAGLDQMLTGITPQGIHRGFRLAPNIGNLKVTVEADPADNDHIVAYTTADGYTLRLRRTGGDFDLNLAAFTNKEVVVAIFAEYSTGVTTFAEIRAYEYDPVDEFTGAAERGELVVLGKVTVPAAGVIPTNDIDPTFRTLAWDHVGSDAAPWEQVIENGSFELAADDTTFVAADRGFVPHWDTQYIPSQHTWEIDSVSPHTGRYSLKVTGSGVAALSVIPPDRIVAVQPGQLVRVSYWLRGDSWTLIDPGGTMGLQLNFYGPNLGLVSFRIVQDKTLVGTFGWQKFDEYIEVPSGVAWMVPAITLYDPTTPEPITSSLVFDDIRIWMSKGPPTIPYSSVQDGLTNGGHVVGQLGIAETNVAQFGIGQDLESFVKGILQLHKHDNISPSLNRYQWKRLDAEAYAIRMVEGALHLEGLIGSSDDTTIARLKAEFASQSQSAYTLLNHYVGPQTADQIRVYASPQTFVPTGSGVPALVTTFNCYWDHSTLRWIADDPGDRAALHVWNEQGAIGHYQMEGVDTVSPWTDLSWTNGMAKAAWDARFKATGFVDSHSTDWRLTIADPTGTYSNLTPIADPGDGNTLQAKNIVKAWARVATNIGAIPTIRGGFNILSTPTYPNAYTARIPFRYTMTDVTDFCAVGSISGGTGDIINVNVAQGYVDLQVRDHAGATLDIENTFARSLSVIVMGLIS